MQLVTLADFYSVTPLLEKCAEMLKFLPNVSSVDKLRLAAKLKSTSLEVTLAGIPMCLKSSGF